jgi:hypothetical protein
MKSHVAFALITGLALSLSGGAARAEAPAGQGPAIDIALALDVSGSMSGLIDSAKIKLWDIVNDLAKDKPAPRLRVALYSYGHTTYDAQKGWVRKELDLTSDLDAIYQKLFALTIDGGEEYVARVSRDAIVEQKWSAEPGAIKHIFVAGNEPASQDPTLALKDVADLAVKNGIHIHTIFCGNPQDGQAADWKEFAKLAKGQFAAIDQNNGTVVINTPLDGELDALNRRLNGTYLVYGGQKGLEQQKNQQEQDGNALKLGAAVQASRVLCKNGCLYRNDAWDLVDRCKNDSKFDVKSLPLDQLNDEMKKMTPVEREAYVKDMIARRDAIQEQINAVGALRSIYVQEEIKKNPKAGDKAFDEAIKKALKR